MTRQLLIAAALLAPSSFAWEDWNRVKEDFRYSYELRPNGRVSVEGFNGSIEITSWERNEIEITGTKYASSDDILREIKVDITNSPDAVTLRAYRPKTDSGWWGKGGAGVKMTLRVPKKVQLERVASSNGGIRVEAIDGNARLVTSNGTIRVAYLNGSLDASTSNGKLDLADINGGMMLRTSNGSIQAENVKGSFEASTSNGAIRARLGSVPPATPIRANSSNGSIELVLDAYNNNEVRASTSNSGITLKLPGQVNADLRAVTSNSNVTSDLDVAVRGTISKSRLEGRIGGGGALINLTSSNGSIRIQKI